MKGVIIRRILLLILWVFTIAIASLVVSYAIGASIVTTFLIPERLVEEVVIENWESICFWPDVGGINAAVSSEGYHSRTCTRPVLKEGTAIIDKQDYKILLETRFILVKTSRFPLPCTEGFSGSGTVQFRLGDLIPHDYEVFFRDGKVGDLKVFSGLPTPRQCFSNQ